jgi:hypothetical protein
LCHGQSASSESGRITYYAKGVDLLTLGYNFWTKFVGNYDELALHTLINQKVDCLDKIDEHFQPNTI